MALTERDVSILSQVAFKAAIENTTGDLLDAETASLFEAKVVYLTDTLVSAVEVAVAKHASSAAASQPAAARGGAGSSPASDGASVRVIPVKDAPDNGPLPAWFIKAAAEKGVSSVFDNRHKLSENPRLPWFKTPKDEGDIAFWPPKAKG
jgi:hypothetical protein